MPRNRADIPRDEKIGAIVEAARTRLVQGGDAELSVAGVARDLDLTQAAIYWYFPTSDHLFVAAMERVLHDILARKPPGGTCTDHVLWFADQLHEVHELRMALRDRARVADVARAFESDVFELFRVMLVNALRPSVQSSELGPTAAAVMALCEGALQGNLPRKERRDLIRFGLERIAPGAASAAPC